MNARVRESSERLETDRSCPLAIRAMPCEERCYGAPICLLWWTPAAADLDVSTLGQTSDKFDDELVPAALRSRPLPEWSIETNSKG